MTLFEFFIFRAAFILIEINTENLILYLYMYVCVFFFCVLFFLLFFF